MKFHHHKTVIYIYIYFCRDVLQYIINIVYIFENFAEYHYFLSFLALKFKNNHCKNCKILQMQQCLSI